MCIITWVVIVDGVTRLIVKTLWYDHPVVEPGFIILVHECSLAEKDVELFSKRYAVLIWTVISIHRCDVFGWLIILTTKFLWFCYTCIGYNVET